MNRGQRAAVAAGAWLLIGAFTYGCAVDFILTWQVLCFSLIGLCAVLAVVFMVGLTVVWVKGDSR